LEYIEQVESSTLNYFSKMKANEHSRFEVMKHLERDIRDAVREFLKPVDEIWQPSDFLPDAHSESFHDDIKKLQERAKGLSTDLLAVLVGNTITEEALPNYEAWLLALNQIPGDWEGGWSQWVRAWTAEENRHGNVLNTYLYLTGRIDMRQMEISTQYLIADGFDIGTTKDPYRNFIYTSFQEIATNVSHRRVAQFAKEDGDIELAKLCGNVASDEARHANAYKSFVTKIFEIDPNEMMLAFADMMKKKIVMPAHFLREMGLAKGQTWNPFSDAAQRIGVYTGLDYIHILKSLIDEWNIAGMRALSGAGEAARDFIMELPNRLEKIAQRSKPGANYSFNWIHQ
jgi:acyl-[acyl-carrier-protein] desaturase